MTEGYITHRCSCGHQFNLPAGAVGMASVCPICGAMLEISHRAVAKPVGGFTPLEEADDESTVVMNEAENVAATTAALDASEAEPPKKRKIGTFALYHVVLLALLLMCLPLVLNDRNAKTSALSAYKKLEPHIHSFTGRANSNGLSMSAVQRLIGKAPIGKAKDRGDYLIEKYTWSSFFGSQILYAVYEKDSATGKGGRPVFICAWLNSKPIIKKETRRAGSVPSVPGVFEISVTPANARVRLEGDGAKVVGEGKDRKIVYDDTDSAQPIVVVISHEGYEELRWELFPSFEVTDSRLPFALAPSKAIYNVKVVPETAELILRGDGARVVGVGAERRIEVDSPDGRTIMVMVQCDGYQLGRQVLQPDKPGEQETLSFVLQKGERKRRKQRQR